MENKSFKLKKSLEIRDFSIKLNGMRLIEEIELKFAFYPNEIPFSGEKTEKNLILFAEADCCSISWFEESDKKFDDLIGKKIIGIEYIGEKKMKKSKIQEFDQNFVYEFILEDSANIQFYLRNSSNGYYTGWINYLWKNEKEKEKKLIKIKEKNSTYYDNILTIIVGLPGSGKTTFAKQYLKDHEIFDDFISDFFTVKKKIMRGLKNKHKICITDPRLCDFNTYDGFLNEFKEQLPTSHIKTICFKNDEKSCIVNVGNNDKKKKDIHKYSKIYDIENGYLNKCVFTVYKRDS
jgi:hypothetical protein